MAAQASHHAPSGRFIRAYLLTWGLLAAGGLTYLASLAWHPQLFTPAQRPQMAEADPGAQTAKQALKEVGVVRGVVIEIQKDLGRIKDNIGQREAEEKAAQERLARLEDRVTTMRRPKRGRSSNHRRWLRRPATRPTMSRAASLATEAAV